MESTVQFKADFIGRFIYVLIRLLYFIQYALSAIFSLIFITPALNILKSKYGENDHDKTLKKTSCVKIYLNSWNSKFIWYYYLKYAFWFESKLSGIDEQPIYSKLITWNTSVPLIGFTPEKEPEFFLLY